MNIPVVLIVFKRTETTRRVFEVIRKVRPSTFYLVADGPKNISQKRICDEVISIVEKGIDWDCNYFKIQSDANLGLARRVQTGLDEVFSIEKNAIILEDDTLPDPSFFRFCEDLLIKYKDNKNVAHISGCNLHPEVSNGNSSYCFSSIINIWGWATWKRAWKHFDLQMPSWEKEHKNQFLQNWCGSREVQKHTRKMFDLHCNNTAPWTWDYQWVYSCWKMNGLSIIPANNLVSNIGIGPGSTHTHSKVQSAPFPPIKGKLQFPLTQARVARDLSFEKNYFKADKLPLARKFKNLTKSLLGLN
ncbi:MAG: hypothetical protein P8O23_04520 [Opitutales bacterium]|nr:hypothetical protein [Opitutales bacterium]